MGCALQVVGIGFEAYFNPHFPPFFKCIYKVAGDPKATVVTVRMVWYGMVWQMSVRDGWQPKRPGSASDTFTPYAQCSVFLVWEHS